MRKPLVLYGALAAAILVIGLHAANFPTSISTTANIPGAVNRARTTLATTITSVATTLVMTSGTAFAVNVPFTIGTEDIICTMKSTNMFSLCTRGYGGSTAAAHSAGVSITGTVIAQHVNTLRDEVIAIETALGPNMANVLPQAANNLAYTGGIFYAPKADFHNTNAGGYTFVRLLGGDTQTGQNIFEIFPNGGGDGIIDVGADGSFRVGDDSSSTTKILLYGDAIDPTLGLASDTCTKWRSAATWDSGTVDLGLCRNAAGVMEINNGTLGTIRDLKLRTLKRSVLTVATLPATPAAGDEVAISDSATGDCVTGGGSLHVNCEYDGSAWGAL